MPHSGPIEIEIARNEKKPCNDPACHRHRERVGGFCKMHARARHLYGHPRGRRVAPREYAPERDEVAAFITEHAEHPAIKAALKWLDEWLVGAWSGNRALPSQKELQRLYGHSVTAAAILTEVAAVWLYSSRSPTGLPDDQRLTYALSLSVLALAPRNATPSPSKPGQSNLRRYSADARRDIGQHLRTNLAPLFANLAAAIKHREDQLGGQQAALRMPFTHS